MSSPFYGSAEIRWFFSEAEGKWSQLHHWFTEEGQLVVRKGDKEDDAPDAEPFVKEESRVDQYLLLPNCETVGVKQREGMLEVKALIVAPRPYARPEWELVGRIDQWVKWSFESIHRAELSIELDQAGPWCRVAKHRYLQKFSFESGESQRVSPDADPDCGCDVEVGQLEVGPEGLRWLTLGFEAFGPTAQTIWILDETVAHFFDELGPPPLPLKGQESLSYPAWLAYCFDRGAA